MLQVYYMDVSQGCSHVESERMKKIIVEERLMKIEKQKDVTRANKLTITSAFLQYVLGKTLGIPANQLSFSYGPWGKPGILNSKIDFSLSHSGKYAVVAVSDCFVGVDIERIRTERLAVAKRFFHEKEYREIERMEDAVLRNQKFVEYWTMKEAYVKREGKGLQIPLNSFLIERGRDNVSYVLPEMGKPICLVTHFLEDSYVVSVCSEDSKAIESFQKTDLQEVSFDTMKNALLEFCK